METLITGVKVDGNDIKADVVVIAMGPWTKLAASWFDGIPRIGAQKAHSIVVEPQSEVTPDCLFLAHTNKQGQDTKTPFVGDVDQNFHLDSIICQTI